MSLADAGQPEKALSCTQTLAATTSNPRYWLTRSYIHRVSGQPYEGLRASQHALALAPADAEVIRNHEQALHTARLNRQADYAAELTRLAPQPTRTSAERFALANRAVQMQEELLDNSTPTSEQSQFLSRLQGDRLIALDVREDIVTGVDISAERGAHYPDYAAGALVLLARGMTIKGVARKLDSS